MPDLTIQVQEIKELAGTALVILNGSIDAKTVITFQTHLNSVRGRGINRFILDMESVKYVNSTGLGYLINLSDSVGSEQGAISLVKVQPKVKVVFDMLGLNAFFRIYGTREDALRHFTSAAQGAASPTDQTAILRAPAAKSESVPARASSGTAVMEPPRTTAKPPSSPSVPSAPADPMQIPCQHCRALLTVKEVGTYKCPRCFAMFTYGTGGRSTFLPRRKSVPVQLSVNFSPECIAGLQEFVRLLARRAGFSDDLTKRVQGAVKETVETIMRQAYGGKEDNVLHVLLTSVDSEIEMRFADTGTSISPEEARSRLFSTVREVMDRFELKNHARGGNVVTVAKKAK